MDYDLWLLADDTGRISLTGWSEAGTDGAAASAPVRTEHWPAYPLCDDRAQLPERLRDLGLDLAPGADLNDLDKNWDVYLRHPDIAALRNELDSRRTPSR